MNLNTDVSSAGTGTGLTPEQEKGELEGQIWGMWREQLLGYLLHPHLLLVRNMFCEFPFSQAGTLEDTWASTILPSPTEPDHTCASGQSQPTDACQTEDQAP